ncbi:MAG: benzoylsuccinyl-CoA thiolase, partial [candidate division NC10 bacterium]|nr:benzoylsuccinyl-CoA thiolase [candidate division NC10 bacterium]
ADCWVEDGGKVFLIGSRCPTCGKHTFPRRAVCDACGTSGEQESVRLPNIGTLYSYSEIHVAPKVFATPYVIGYVDLPGDVRVFGQVEHAASELRPDEPVEVVLGVIRKLDSGQPVTSYKFRKTGGTRNA